MELTGNRWRENPSYIATAGYTVADMCTYLTANIAAMTGAPEHILINLGANDVNSPPAEATWKGDYRTIIELLHTKWTGATIYLAKPVLLNAAPPSTPKANCATIWGWIDDLVGEYDYVYPGLDESELEGGDAYVTNLADTAHPTYPDGYEETADLWMEAIQTYGFAPVTPVPAGAITLFDATLELAKVLGVVYEGIATGGSTQTLVDSTRVESNDFFNNGVIWFRSGNNSYKSAVITDWSLANTAFTFLVHDLACVEGDLYSACTSDWQRGELVSCINLALRKIGKTPKLDTSLAVVENQEAYDLPGGVSELLRVEIGQTGGCEYTIHQNWREENGDLMFDAGKEPTGTGTIRITYAGAHETLIEDTDIIDPQIDLEWLVWAAAVDAWRKRIGHSEGKDSWVLRMFNEAMAQEALCAGRRPVELDRDAHLARW
jgi:hypothetical protein